MLGIPVCLFWLDSNSSSLFIHAYLGSSDIPPLIILSDDAVSKGKSTYQFLKSKLPTTKVHRGWCPKFATGINIIIRQSWKSIWLTNLLFCQNDSPIRTSFWQKDSLITHMLFELCLFRYLAECTFFSSPSILGLL